MTTARLGFDFIDLAETPGAAFDAFTPKPAEFLDVCPLDKPLGAPLRDSGANSVILRLELAASDCRSKLRFKLLRERNI
ncbi:hypothetical protein [Methylocystis hirsuta]|uniref:hypothetical protein n=1 Tax=Methylocystis hirsuta TaxID=369798 RepID=UPI00147533FD|nr:hypothetical protein [Methylocystis hirsuta]